jgi:lipopolysaccharide/colanic/teichoic acid biosynthesis glycosyltransferase
VDRLQGAAARVRELRPGITGPASLAFRNEELLLARVADPVAFNDHVLFPEKVRLNLRYMETISLTLDLGYILVTLLPAREETVPAILNCQGSRQA